MYHDAPKGPTVGFDVICAKYAVHAYEVGLLPKPSGGFTPQFGPALYEALRKVIQPSEGIPASGDIGKGTWDILWPLLTPYRKSRYLAWARPTPAPNPVPDLGPLYQGGASVLYHSLTHNTDGPSDPSDSAYDLSEFYPAFDDGWIGGRTIWAVENLTVIKASSSSPGDAFFALGRSKIRWWYGHLRYAPSVGRTFRKGDAVGQILSQSGGKSHVHLGMDTRLLIGHRLLYGATGNGPDYTYGSPTVVTQLREYLSL